MPALSPTMTEGTLAKWLKGEGDKVESGDILVEIETDKATMEVEAADEGVLAKILVDEGTGGVKVNEVIALILEEGEEDAALHETPAVPSPAPEPPAERILVSPLAKRLAGQAELDLDKILGSGPGGRIVKRDVAAARAATPPPEVAGVPAYREVPNSTMRKVIAQRLGESKRNIPHYYLSVDCRLDALQALRRDLNAKSPQGEGAYKLSVNDFVVRAVALALRRVPAANASWTVEAVRLYEAIDVAVAVATPDGLVTPVVRGADNKGLAAISGEIRELAGRAREGKLAPGEYQGGGFTISNLGMYGIKEFAAIINPPQSCILAVGAAEQRPVVEDGKLAVGTVMTCTLSIDHRSVDGALGAEFLAAFQGFIEEPLTMLL